MSKYPVIPIIMLFITLLVILVGCGRNVERHAQPPPSPPPPIESMCASTIRDYRWTSGPTTLTFTRQCAVYVNGVLAGTFIHRVLDWPVLLITDPSVATVGRHACTFKLFELTITCDGIEGVFYGVKIVDPQQ